MIQKIRFVIFVEMRKMMSTMLDAAPRGPEDNNGRFRGS